MQKIGELLTKKLEKLELEKKDFKDIFDAIVENESEVIDKDKKHNELKVKFDEAESKNADLENLKNELNAKEKEILDLKIKYIDRFENGKKDEEKEKEEDEGTEPTTIDDLFENEEGE